MYGPATGPLAVPVQFWPRNMTDTFPALSTIAPASSHAKPQPQPPRAPTPGRIKAACRSSVRQQETSREVRAGGVDAQHHHRELLAREAHHVERAEQERLRKYIVCLSNDERRAASGRLIDRVPVRRLVQQESERRHVRMNWLGCRTESDARRSESRSRTLDQSRATVASSPS